MTHLSLAGGTDVAEVALFSVDVLPERFDPSVVDRLHADGFLLRFETGSDGGYLLHAYVDEPVPEGVMKYCQPDGMQTGRLHVGAHGVAFGGLETVVRDVDPNPLLRTDALIPAGAYDVTAYFTNFPPDVLDAAMTVALGRGGRRLLDLPGYIIGLGVVVAGSCLLFSAHVAAAVVAAATFAGLKWLYFANPKIRQLQRDQLAVEVRYPAIVVRMRSANTHSCEVSA